MNSEFLVQRFCLLAGFFMLQEKECSGNVSMLMYGVSPKERDVEVAHVPLGRHSRAGDKQGM